MSNILRIIDASLNRAAEGLRVVEDYVRFALDDGHLTEEFKRLRHDLAEVAAVLPLPERHAARDTRRDVGTEVTTPSEGRREDAWGVCFASLERVKQSLRSLEEFCKLGKPEAAGAFEALRYRLYTLEAAVGRTTDGVRRLESVRLYVLLDGCENEAEFANVVRSFIGAVDAIQLRDKHLHDHDLVSRARLLRELVSPNRLPPSADSSPLIIINDRPDIAAAIGADGVHLGQDDLSVKDARAVLGPNKLIGISTHTIEQARAAVLDGANYLGTGPTYRSTTKDFQVFSGLEFLREVAAEISLPAFAIGGINAENIDEVLATGASRVAISSPYGKQIPESLKSTDFSAIDTITILGDKLRRLRRQE